MSSDESVHDPKTASFNAPESRVRIEVADAAEAQGWLDKAAAGDFIVRLEERLDEGVVVEVVIGSGVMEVPLRCHVKQVFRSGTDRHGTMVRWLDRDGARAEDFATLGGQPDSERRSLFEPRRFTRKETAPEPDASAAEAAQVAADLRSPESWAEETFPEVEELRREAAAAKAEEMVASGTSEAGVEASNEALVSSKVPRLKLKRPAEPEDGPGLFDLESLNPESDHGLEVDATETAAESAADSSATADEIRLADSDADELEALLSESGQWRAQSDQPSDADSSEAAADVGDQGLGTEAKQALVHNETRGTSLAHTIGQMNPNEKARLATRASRQERRLLLRDHTFSVQMGLLNNPRTENKEILEIAKNAQTTGGILKRLASDRKWAGNYELQAALVKHPGTPSPLAIRLLDKMRLSDLRVLAKSSALRENVRKAALRLYLRRSS